LYGTDEGRTTLGRMSIRRRLRKNERDIIVAMLDGNPSHAELMSRLEADAVEDMQDGGMGGIRFFADDKGRRPSLESRRRNTPTPTECLSAFVLNADAMGALYEIDFWKVDFSPLRRYPLPSDLRLK
jgi:hypothetical protein